MARKRLHDFMMTRENDHLPKAGKVGQSRHGAAATFVVEVDQNVVGEHGQRSADVCLRFKQGDS